MDLQESPVAEVNMMAGAVTVAYNDTKVVGNDADAKTISLKIRGTKLDLLMEMMQSAVAVKVSSTAMLKRSECFH